MKKNIAILLLTVLWIGTVFFYGSKQPKDVCQVVEVRVSELELNRWVEISEPLVYGVEVGSLYVNFQIKLKEKE